MKKLTRYILIYVFMLLCVFSAFVGVYGVKNANALEAIPMATLSLKGSGRYRDPYLISNAKEYNNFSDYVNAGNTMSGKYIQLNADINFSSTKLKTINKTFSGNLNGKYHTMSNVTATLFNSISSARISYINIEKARIMVYGEDVDYVGIISNTSNSSTIQYIHILSGSCSDGIVSRGANVGGLLGYINNNTVVEYCDNAANVTSNNGNAGGICALAGQNSTVNCCSNTGNISGKVNLGGIIGSTISEVTIKNCFNRGNIKSSSESGYNGGIVGYSTGKVETSYSLGEVSKSYATTSESAKPYKTCSGGAFWWKYERIISLEATYIGEYRNSSINGNPKPSSSNVKCYGVSVETKSRYMDVKVSESGTSNGGVYTVKGRSDSTLCNLDKGYSCLVGYNGLNGNMFSYLPVRVIFYKNYEKKDWLTWRDFEPSSPKRNSYESIYDVSSFKSVPSGFSSDVWFCSSILNDGYPTFKYKYWEGIAQA